MKIILASVDKEQELSIEKVEKKTKLDERSDITELVAQVSVGGKHILVDIDELASAGIAIAESIVTEVL